MSEGPPTALQGDAILLEGIECIELVAVTGDEGGCAGQREREAGEAAKAGAEEGESGGLGGGRDDHGRGSWWRVPALAGCTTSLVRA